MVLERSSAVAGAIGLDLVAPRALIVEKTKEIKVERVEEAWPIRLRRDPKMHDRFASRVSCRSQGRGLESGLQVLDLS